MSKTILDAISDVILLSRSDIYVDVSDDPEDDTYDEQVAIELQAFSNAIRELERQYFNLVEVSGDPVSVVEYIERNAEGLGARKSLTLFSNP